ATVLLLGHAVVWLRVAWRKGLTIEGILHNWDGGYYTAIATGGYSGKLWAFYPLYPLTVRASSALLGVTKVQWVGAALSTLALLAFVALAARAAERTDVPAGLVPRPRLGWLAFLFAPASFAFHAHHTEALFLLLSFLSLHFSGTRRPALG